jgi:hypothetical protein
MEPEFINPPPPKRQQDTGWERTIAALIAKSGQWARILIGDYKDAGRVAGRARKSRGAWAGHEWEVTTRNSGDLSAIHVYARHIRPLNSGTPTDEGDDNQ